MERKKARQKIKLPQFGTFSGTCASGVLTVDHRKMNIGDETQLLPIAVRVASHHKKTFLQTGRRMTLVSFEELCTINSNPRSKKRADEIKFFRGMLQRAKDLVAELETKNIFSLEILKDRFSGKEDEGETINSIWAKTIESMRKEEKNKTADNYQHALRHFTKDMGAKVSFARITNSFILEWRKKMLASGLNGTTAAIYLRTMRRVVNICLAQGLMQGNTRDLFKNGDLSFTNMRTGEFLNAETMQRLYDLWLADEAKDANGKEMFAPREKRALFRDLGYFLFSYLGNGMNIRDMVELKYDNHYYNTNGAEFYFLRHKVAKKSKNKAEVKVPLDLEPLKTLLSRLANTPILNGYVFPILSGKETEYQKDEKAHKVNANIRKALGKLAPLAGLSVKPTATWARHSFAKNLSEAGVDAKYIDMAMAHANGAVNSHYISLCTHKKCIEYNCHLLPMMQQDSKRDKLMAAGFTKEQVELILSAL